jgi:hypothetical protein
MADLAHLIGSDLEITDNGNVVLSYDEEEGQERVLRRLLSNPGSYYFHLDYGAGLAQFLGKTLVSARIKGVIQQQMLLEQAVLQNPPPQINILVNADQTVTATVQYVDSTTNLTSLLTVPIEGF